MICNNCHNEIGTANFCPVCGVRIVPQYQQPQYNQPQLTQEQIDFNRRLQNDINNINMNSGSRIAATREFTAFPFLGFGLAIAAYIFTIIIASNRDILNSFFYATFVGITALVFSIIGSRKKNRLFGFGIAGIPLSAVIILISFILAVGQSVIDSYDEELNNKLPFDDYASVCERVDYENVSRSPYAYEDRDVYFQGEIIQVSEATTTNAVRYTLRVAQNGSYDQIWYVEYIQNVNDDRLLNGDKVLVYGECTGVTTYTSVLGESITIPSIDAQYIIIK